MSRRTDKLVSGFLADGFTWKETHFRPLTAQTLLVLEKIQSPFFTGAEEGVRGLLDFLFVSSQPVKEILPLLKDRDAWDLAVFEFASQFSAADLEELGRLVAQENENVAAAVVEARDDGKTKKKPQSQPQTNRTGAPN